MKRKNLTDRVIAITGASAGIGRATAIACANAGMDVVVSARRLEPLDSLVEQIESTGRRAVAVVSDVTSKEDSQQLVQIAQDTFGRLDAILANAGRGLNRPVDEMTDEDMRSIFEVNFFGTMNTVHAALPIFKEQKHGHILMTSSCLSRFSLPFHGAYAATKASQTQIARAMRLELAGKGIDVSVVHPITTITDFFEVSAEVSGTPNEGASRHAPKMFVQPASRVANAIVRCLKKPRPEVWTSHIVRTVAGTMVIFPFLGDLLLRKEVERQEARRSASQTSHARE